MMQRTPRRPLWLLMACLLVPAGGCIFTNHVQVPCDAPGPPPAADVGAHQVIEAGTKRVPAGEVQVIAQAVAAQGFAWPGVAAPVLPKALGTLGIVAPERLQIPAELPGSGVPPIQLSEDKAKRKKQIEELYQALPPLGEELRPAPGPNGMPLTLPELEQIGLARNPGMGEARADVEASRGAAIQAGLYPNPVVGFQGDQIGSAGTPGQLGAYLEQLIKTAGKLRLARLV